MSHDQDRPRVEREFYEQDPLRIEREFYEIHKLEWLRNHHGEFAVVRGNELLGFFPGFQEAFSAAVEKYGTIAAFLVKRVVPIEPLFQVDRNLKLR